MSVAIDELSFVFSEGSIFPIGSAAWFDSRHISQSDRILKTWILGQTSGIHAIKIFRDLRPIQHSI